MGRKAAIGRAFRVSDRDVRSYEWTARPRRMTPNPMGVTHLAQVNGHGAYSARAASHGLTPAERLSRARKLVGGGGMRANKHRAKFVRPLKANAPRSPKSIKANKRSAGKRLAAYSAARRRGLNPNSARRSALRNAPFTANERTKGASFMGSRARRKKYRGNMTAAQYEKEARKASQRQAAASASGEFIGPLQQHPRKKRKAAKKTKRKAAKKTKRKASSREYKTVTVRSKRKVTAYKTVSSKRKMRVAYGKYTRAKLYNPRTGRVEYSYMYKTKHGYRRIPTKSVIGKSKGFKGFNPKAIAKLQAARKKAADRILTHGDTFIANKSRKKRKVAKKRKLKNTKAARKARARYRASKRAGAPRKRKGAKRRSSAKRRKVSRKAKRGSGKRKATGGRRGYRTRYNKLRAAGYTHKQAQKGAKASNVGRKVSRKRRKGGKRKAARRGTARRAAKRRSPKRSKRRMKRNRFHRRNGFMAQLKDVLKLGLTVYVGYAAHRVITALLTEHVYDKYIVGTNAMLKQWEKPIVGAVVGVAEVALIGKVPSKVFSEKTKLAMGAGVIASWLQSVAVTGLAALSQPKYASYLEGYSNSTAYNLQGYNRNTHHGMRGLGAQVSIAPRYTPIGAFQQAAAGMGAFQQAAAGMGAAAFQQAAAGVGEYFAPRGTQGVGAYEAAGPLAMQAAAGLGDPIDDGIRPDSNLDHVLDLAESAAGLGGRRRGTGEFFTPRGTGEFFATSGLGEFFGATPGAGGGFDEMTVGQQSQWIPNGPLWAGTLNVKGTPETSEIPAGVLAGPGGNGTLSG